jgi:hypothetical protein
MILQYRLPVDVPELDARAGDVISIDPRGEAYAWLGRPCNPSVAAGVLSRLFSSLEPVQEPVAPDLARALLSELGDKPPRRAKRAGRVLLRLEG